MKQFSNITGKKIFGSREEFIKLLLFLRPFGSMRNQVTVVFDGYSDSYPVRSKKSNIDIVFSKEESADDKIIKIVLSYKNPKRIIVVTDDKQIKLRIKTKVYNVVSCKDFMKNTARKHITDKKEEPCEKPDFSETQAIQITKELERIWLGRKVESSE